eukprot:4741021-Amphidinium_carterae.1
MPGPEVLSDRRVSLQSGGFGPLDLESPSIFCQKTEGPGGGTVPTVPSHVHIPFGESGVPTLLVFSPKNWPLLGR